MCISRAFFIAPCIFLGLTGCDSRPTDELGLKAKSLVLANVGGRDTLSYWRMDGQPLVTKTLNSPCRTNFVFNDWDLQCENPNGEIVILGMDGRVLAKLGRHCYGLTAVAPDRVTEACWDSNGTILTVYLEGSGAIEVFNADNYRIARTARLTGTFPSPLSWTRDSGRLYFSSAGRIFVYSVRSHALEELSVKGDWPKVAPEGSRILYRDGITRQAAILDLTGRGAVRQLAVGPLWYPASWSVDGNYVLANRKGEMKLIIWRLSDGKSQDVRIWDEDLKAQYYGLVRTPINDSSFDIPKRDRN